jgi:hypothetical protein
MENKMKTTLVALLLLSLALTGCVVDPYGGYGNRGYGDRGWRDHEHAEYRGDYGQYRGQYGDANYR